MEADGIAEIRSPDFPGERLLVCLNPRLRHERARKREDLLSATERILETIARAVRSPHPRLRGQEAINRRVGRDVSRKKVDKHFAIEVTDAEIRWSRKQDKINAEAQLAVRPIFVYSEDHVHGHILLCMLVYYVEWHLRRRLAPLLFEEEDRAGARALRQSPVEKAQVSASTKAKAASKQTPEGLPVHSFQTLLADLGTLTLNEVTLPDAPQHPFPMVAKPTPLQAKAFDLLGVDPGKFVASKLAG